MKEREEEEGKQKKILPEFVHLFELCVCIDIISPIILPTHLVYENILDVDELCVPVCVCTGCVSEREVIIMIKRTEYEKKVRKGSDN